MKRKKWNPQTRLAWHWLLEHGDDLEALARARSGSELGMEIHHLFVRWFRIKGCPFARWACRNTVADVNFRQLADRLTAMLAKRAERQQSAKR